MEIPRREHAVVGVRQSLRLIAANGAEKAYVARDVDPAIAQPFVQMCNDYHVEIEYVDSKKHLGRLCGIDVDASVVVIKKG
ncbi:MAG: 50S ribosomal protein L7ae-like protein [Ruminococcaceae bacterium]|nr:50S ribosomal protein L7ae-like protein [Oscillospiraceae bacterium]